MAISPRASAPEGRGWTIVRPLGARAVPTSAALQELPSGSNELVVVQTFRIESDRTGDPVRDLRALINLRNPNVARLKEVVEKDGSVHVVTHFVDGETLGSLREQGRIPFGVELRVLVDVLTGLGALNGVKDAKLKPINFVHGEIAPANIVIGTDGVAKVVQLCGVHAVPGAQGNDTVGWLAPEILLADDTFDQRVDVYGVGVMLWEALTGTTLFPETNAGAIVTRHLSGRIKKPAVPADAPWAEPFVDIAMKAISTDPGSRYSNAGELAAEIKRVAKSNLAMTPKVAALVKERAGEKIAARRAALGGGAVAGAAKVSVPKATQTKLATPLVSPPKVDEPAKIPETPIILAPHDGEDLQESAIKPVLAPPEPSVHERTTTPSPIPEEKAKDLVEEQAADFSDFSLDDEEPAVAKAPPGPPPKKDVVTPFPAPEPALALVPTPPPAFVAAPPPMAASPFPPVDVPAAAPAATPPFAEEAAAPSSPRSRPEDVEPVPEVKRSPALWIGLGIAAVVVLLISLKTCTSKTDATAGGAPSASAVTTAAAKAPEPKPTEDPAIAATAANTGTGAAPTATEVPTAATAEPSATVAPTATEPPPKVDTPPPPKAVGPAPTSKPTSKPKPPKPAYDPQGI